MFAVADESFGALLDRAASGDERAFADLVGPLLPALRGYLRAIGRDEVEDLLVDVLLAVHRRLDRFVGHETGFRSWVFTIAHNVGVDHYRRRRRRPEPVDTTDPKLRGVLGVVEGVDAIVVDHALDRRLEEVLSQIPELHRRVLLLRTAADLSVEETAKVLGRTEGSVRVLHHRALKRVRRLIESAES